MIPAWLTRAACSPARLSMVAIVLGLAGLFAAPLVYPTFGEATLEVSGQESSRHGWPYFTPEGGAGFVTWRIPIQVSDVSARSFAFLGNGYIQSILVNGTYVSHSYPIDLGGSEFSKVNLRGYLRTGENEVTVVMQKGEGRAGMRIFTDPTDPLHLALLALSLAVTALCLRAFHLWRPDLLPGSLAFILFAGIALRILYVSATPCVVRSYDFHGHIRYIRYIVEHFAQPERDWGWETHQPPLYYWICAILVKGLSPDTTPTLYGILQFFSLLLSVGSFLLCVPIARLLFPAVDSRLPRAIFVVLMAGFPGLVFVSSRVSNDVLYAFLSFLWFYLLLRNWRQPQWGSWLCLFFCLGIGMLAKNTTLVLIVVTGACIAIHPALAWKRRAVLVGAMLAMILVLSGWYQIPMARQSTGPTTFVVAPRDVGAELRLPRSLSAMLTFNPVKVVRIPFTDTRDDAYRRKFFAEFYFKSSLFGEFKMPAHLGLAVRGLVITALALLPLIAAGMVVSFRQKESLFWLAFITAGSLLGSCLLYFWKAPDSCNQDFRYHVIILSPLFYWLVKAGDVWPRTLLAAALLFAGSSALFFALLLFS